MAQIRGCRITNLNSSLSYWQSVLFSVETADKFVLVLLITNSPNALTDTRESVHCFVLLQLSITPFSTELLKILKLNCWSWFVLLQLYPSVENVRTSLEGYPGE